MKVYSVVLAGGNGTRLWPLSRAEKPKQFLSLLNELSLFQECLKRHDLYMNRKTIILTGIDHLNHIEKQLEETGIKNTEIIVEPVSKNTGPAVTSAVLKIYAEDPGALIIVTPSDNEIRFLDEYNNSLESAAKFARDGYFVTFGIKPTRAEPGYGYIRGSDEIDENVLKVKRFIEKPDIEKAKEYFNSGNYYWNSGIFVFSAQTYFDSISFHAPKILTLVKKSLDKAKIKGNKTFLNKDSFERIIGDSIDYMLMEKVNNIAMVKTNFFWSDIGSWKSIWETGEHDLNGNIMCENSIAYNTQNSLINSSSGRLVAAVDLENICIIDTPDALLVTNSNTSNNVKHIVNELLEKKRSEALTANTKVRPWGSYENIKTGDNFLIKKIVVAPSQKLSLQYHHYRSEHWVVVKGIAEVTIGNTVKILKENEYIFIPQHAHHRLANIGTENLELVELQFGNVLDESDIVRLEDIYNRS